MSETVNKESLLDKAKKVKKGHLNSDVTEEKIQLALAWVKGDVSTAQIKKAIETRSSSNVYTLLAHALKEHIKQSNNH